MFLSQSGDTVHYKKINALRLQLARQMAHEATVFDCLYNRLVDDYIGNLGLNSPKRLKNEVSALCDTLSAMEYFDRSGWNRGVVHLARYLAGGDPGMLHKAMAEAPLDEAGIKTSAAGYLALHYIDRNQVDSAPNYIALFERGAAEPAGDDLRIYRLGATLYTATGDTARAAIMQSKADETAKIIDALQFSAAALSPQTENLIRRLEDNNHTHNINYLAAGITALLVITGAAVCIKTLTKRRKRHMAPDIVYARQLRGTIMSKLAKPTKWDDLSNIFLAEAPQFGVRLKAAYPDLTPGDLRLATGIVLSLESKRLAILLDVTPDAIKKGRQRLRKRLNLPPEADLAVFLSAYLAK